MYIWDVFNKWRPVEKAVVHCLFQATMIQCTFSSMGTRSCIMLQTAQCWFWAGSTVGVTLSHYSESLDSMFGPKILIKRALTFLCKIIQHISTSWNPEFALMGCFRCGACCKMKGNKKQCCGKNPNIKGTVHPKLKIQSLSSHPHADARSGEVFKSTKQGCSGSLSNHS